MEYTLATMQTAADAAHQNVERIDQNISRCLALLQHLQTHKAAAITTCYVVNTVKNIVEDDTEAKVFDDADCEDDFAIHPRDRKVRSDVLTVRDAVKAGCKTSKNHKLKPKSERVDRTKTKEARATRRAWLGGYMRESKEEPNTKQPELKQSKAEEQEPDNRSHKR